MTTLDGAIMETPKRRRGCLGTIFIWTVRLVLIVVLFALGGFCGAFAPQLYHHFYLFPKQAAEWKKLSTQRTPVVLQTGWQEYRGVMHSHSHLSHDSEVQFPDIVQALHKAQCQFIFLTDHVVDGKGDYSQGWKGLHDGILFVRGFEMQSGFMPWGLPDDTILRNDEDPAALAKKVRELGGVTFLAHCEAPRPFDIPEVDGMEIYNIHTDLLDEVMEKHSRPEIVKECLMNMRSYGDQTLRMMCDEWVLMMLTMQWDHQSKHRRLTGIAANDCHQNVGLRGIYTAQNTLLLLDTGHNDPQKKVKELPLNAVYRWALRLCFGPLSADKELFRIDLDPYERSARLVNTHLLAKELTEPALLEALRAGRAFVAFNMIADASGFAYVAEGNGQQVTMGGSLPLCPGLKLRAEAPLPCRFTLVCDGNPIDVREGKEFEFEVKKPGKYRVEAALKIVGSWTPWILANPIEISETAP